MSIPEKEFELLDKLINDYINEVAKAKYRLTKKIINLAKKYGVNETKDAVKSVLLMASLEKYGERIKTLISKYIPSAPYIEKSDSGRSEYVMGWYSTDQLHSVLLPIQIEDDCIFVNFYGFRNKKDEYLKLFKPSENIPYHIEDGINVYRNISIVSIWINMKLRQYQINDSLWAAALYIAFFPLASVEDVYLRSLPVQMNRIDGGDDECDYWYVQRNIKELGFWHSYQWFTKCRSWYQQHRPDMFVDQDSWNWGLEAGKDVGSMYDESIWLSI